MVSCLMGDSTALASAIVRCCPKPSRSKGVVRPFLERPGWLFVRRSLILRNNLNVELKNTAKALFVSLEVW